LKGGEPGLTHIVTALESGLDVVTSNRVQKRNLSWLLKDVTIELRNTAST
jgi:hypothetical protein